MAKGKGKKKQKSLPEYVADYETITDPEDCRVWAWGCCDISAPEDTYRDGNSDFDFIFGYCKSIAPANVGFHNEKFDGMFILDLLFKNGYTHVQTEFGEPEQPGTFTTMISDLGQFYQIKVMYKETGEIITFFDTAKLINASVDKMAKDFGLPLGKISEDDEFYDRYREPGHELTDEEREYLRHDVLVVAKVLKMLRDAGMEKMTTAGCALSDFTTRFGGKKAFKAIFPTPRNDADIRQSYRGGWTYCNPKIAGQNIGEGVVLDVNSLYPSVMRYELLPYGEPMYFFGKYKKDVDFQLYVQHIKCSFEIKPEHVPMIQIKHSFRFDSNEYLTSSNGEEVDLVLTSVDLELFLEQYDVYNIEYIDGWMYAGFRGFFDEYIDYWTNEKIKAKKEGNKCRYAIAKIFLNSLYGKFGMNPVTKSKLPYWDEEKNRVSFRLSGEETRDGLSIAMASFITSYARAKTIRAAQACYDRFCYADTDSIHLIGQELPEGLDIDSYKLGAWDDESYFRRARFLHAKCYIEDTLQKDGSYKLKVTIAGLPHKLHDKVTWENFKQGVEYDGKLVPKVVNGGVVLQKTQFKIK